MLSSKYFSSEGSGAYPFSVFSVIVDWSGDEMLIVADVGHADKFRGVDSTKGRMVNSRLDSHII